MDYETKSASRKATRFMANLFRKIFGLQPTGSVDPLLLLDKLNKVYKDVDYDIVNSKVLPENIPARCLTTVNNEFIIQISEDVFNGAYERNQGDCRTHILHEIIHPFVDKQGFKPIYNRSLKNHSIPAYKSLEWIVKAVTGEVMMPYEETKGLSVAELKEKYGVSTAAAEYRQTY